jgi:sterol 3beta-glucosyltransferase
VRNLTVEALTDALISATTDIKQVERARAIGAQIRSENGVVNAIQALYRDLDYARSLIKVKAAGQNAENATIREAPGDDANASDSPTPDSDWSVIEDSDDDSDDSHSPRHAVPAELEGRPGVTIPQRPSLVANVTHAVSSVLPGTRKNPS